MDTLGPEIFKNPHPDKTWKARVRRWTVRLGGAALLIGVGVASSSFGDREPTPSTSWDMRRGIEQLAVGSSASDLELEHALGAVYERTAAAQAALAEFALEHQGRPTSRSARAYLRFLRDQADQLLQSLPSQQRE